MGTTGSGKSCTIAGLIRWSYEAAQQQIEDNYRADKKEMEQQYKTIMKEVYEEYKAVNKRIEEEYKENKKEKGGQYREKKKKLENTYKEGKKELENKFKADKKETEDQYKKQQKPNMSFLIFDYNGEYIKAFRHEKSNIDYMVLDAVKERNRRGNEGNDQLKENGQGRETEDDSNDDIKQLRVPYQLWGFEEWRCLLKPSDKTQEPALGEVVKKFYIPTPSDKSGSEKVTLDTVRKKLKPLNERNYLSSLLARIDTLKNNEELKEIAEVSSGDEELCNYWIPGTDELAKKQVIIVDLSGMSSDSIVHIIVSVMLRAIFSEHKEQKIKGKSDLNTILIFEEAHRFLSRDFDTDKEFSLSRLCLNSCSIVAREGRKFGLNLVVSSQMPHGISAKVLSQCNTFILHRIVGEQDQDHMRKLIPDRIRNLVQELPGLPTGQAYLLGWAIKIPTLVRINNLPDDFQPDSKDPPIWYRWTHPPGQSVKKQVDKKLQKK